MAFSASIIPAILVDIHAFNLHLVLIYIFMMSNEVETTFYMFFFFAIWVSCFMGTYSNILLFLFGWFVDSGQPFVVSIFLVGILFSFTIHLKIYNPLNISQQSCHFINCPFLECNIYLAPFLYKNNASYYVYNDQ